LLPKEPKNIPRAKSRSDPSSTQSVLTPFRQARLPKAQQ